MANVATYIPSSMTPSVVSPASSSSSSGQSVMSAVANPVIPAQTVPSSVLGVGGNSGNGGKDSRWLTLEVCREHVRRRCTRSDDECRFAHPPAHVEVQNGRVICCFDSIKGRCQRTDPPCKYLHPPQHLKEQLLQNGRNNLIMRNLHQLQRVHPIPPAAAVYSFVSPYIMSAGAAGGAPCYAPYCATAATSSPSQCVVAASTTNQLPELTSNNDYDDVMVGNTVLDTETVSNTGSSPAEHTNHPAPAQQYWTLQPTAATPGTVYAVDAANNAATAGAPYFSPMFFQNVTGAGTAPGLLLKPHHQQAPTAVVGDGKNGYAVYSCASPLYQFPVNPQQCYPLAIAAGPSLVGTAAARYQRY